MMKFSLDSQMMLILLAAFTAGLALGAFYFTALWHTVRKLPSANKPSGLLIVSFFLRMGVIMAGFFLIIDAGHWERLAAAMVGFIIIRKILTFRLGPQTLAETIN